MGRTVRDSPGMYARKSFEYHRTFLQKVYCFSEQYAFFAAFMADADQESRRNNLKKCTLNLKKRIFYYAECWYITITATRKAIRIEIRLEDKK